MELSNSLILYFGYAAILLFVYFGVTKSSNFKSMPVEKQVAGKMRVRIMLILFAVTGFYQIYSGV